MSASQSQWSCSESLGVTAVKAQSRNSWTSVIGVSQKGVTQHVPFGSPTADESVSLPGDSNMFPLDLSAICFRRIFLTLPIWWVDRFSVPNTLPRLG